MTVNLSCVGCETEPKSFTYDWKDLVLYALGVGATATELDYLFEKRGPRPLPTFAVIPSLPHVFACLQKADIDLASVVHGSQTVHVRGEIPASGELVTQARIEAIYDMKRFAQLVVSAKTSLADGRAVFDTQCGVIVRGGGGFGGPHPPRREESAIPKDREPDFQVMQKTSPEQAILYRLNGDTNPLHIDPEVASAAGFERGPILHGLATFGFAARGIINGMCGGQAWRLRSIHGQFRKPVWPGDTLVTEGWMLDDRLVFQVKVHERSEVVMGNAWAMVDR